MTTTPTLRTAALDDADLLYDWVNRPDSLSGKVQTTEPIRRDVHQAWFESRLGVETCRISLILIDGKPVGQVRLEDRGEGFEVDIYVEPGARGNGIASAAITQAHDDLRKTWPDASLIAKVKLGNPASQALFKGLGFSLTGTQNGVSTFRLEAAD